MRRKRSLSALRQQERRAAQVRIFRHHLEEVRLTRRPLARKEVRMAYYKLLIHVWCDWDPEENNLEEIGRHVVLGEYTDDPLFYMVVAPPPARCSGNSSAA